MKGPTDVLPEPAADATGAYRAPAGRPRETGKALRRQELFLDQRGLTHDAPQLSPDEPGGTSLYLRGAQRREAMLAQAGGGPEWHPVGPAGIPRGQTYGSGPGSLTTVAGRVTAIAVDPTDSDHVLVGSAAGGIWRTRDRGDHWTPLTDDQPTLSIGALSFDPSDPATVYAGTGEGNSEYAALGQGLLVSHDSGTSWQLLARTTFAGIGFYRLVVDPRHSARLLVATTGGAAVSPDGGATWSLLHRGLTWDVSLAYHGNEAEVLLAARDGLFLGKNSAAPTNITLPGLSGSLDPNRERMAVSHNPSDPGEAFVFAAFGGAAHLLHRPGADQPFSAIPLPHFSVPPNVDDVLDVGQAVYDWYAAASPLRAGVVYLGAIELVRGERSGHGWTWTDISSRQAPGDSIHPDQHTIAFDTGSGALYAGNDGGVFSSSDGGDSWRSLNAGLAISEVEYLTQRPDDPDWILAGLQDNGTVRRAADGTWEQVGLGDGGDCGTDYADPDVCYHSYYRMYLERSDRRGDRDSWTNITPPENPQAQELFYPPVEVNGDVVVKAGEVVHLSSDRGNSWSQVRLPAAGGRRSIASALAIPTPTRVLVGTINGDLFRIDRAQGNWGQPHALTRPQDGWMSDLHVDPRSPDVYWATFSSPGAVLRSDDQGATWTNVTANLPAVPVNAIIGDPADLSRFWVACDVGVYESRDSGGTWTLFGTGLPNALAEDLLFHETARLLRVGTRSRGMWQINPD
jgi:photosystem II stability/assembly factor-like uncharacterized protein